MSIAQETAVVADPESGLGSDLGFAALQPVVFLSHGTPMSALGDNPSQRAWRRLGETLRRYRPQAVVVISAHWQGGVLGVGGDTRALNVGGDRRHGIFHDFYGFPEALYRLEYTSAGAPEVARRIVDLVNTAGWPAQLHCGRGLDHGAWIPLRAMFPAGDVPVVPVSLIPAGGSLAHYQLGQVLRTLRRQEVAIVATGASSHNVGAALRAENHASSDMRMLAFYDWLQRAVVERDVAALLDFYRQAPHGQWNHPDVGHLLPLFVALGALADDALAHELVEVVHGCLPMDVWHWTARGSQEDSLRPAAYDHRPQREVC